MFRTIVPSSRDRDCAILGVRPGASVREMSRAWRRIARSHHPDKTSAPESVARYDEASSAWSRLTAVPDNAARAPNVSCGISLTLDDVIGGVCPTIEVKRRVVVEKGSGSRICHPRDLLPGGHAVHPCPTCLHQRWGRANACCPTCNTRGVVLRDDRYEYCSESTTHALPIDDRVLSDGWRWVLEGEGPMVPGFVSGDLICVPVFESEAPLAPMREPAATHVATSASPPVRRAQCAQQ